VAMTTKDLRVASILTATLLRTGGLAGFHSGLQLIRGYLDNFWPEVFPLLDATENNDPSERVNALSNLAAPFGSDGDLLKIIAGLRKAPLLSAPRTGRYGLEHYMVVRELTTWPADAGPAPTETLLDAAKQEVGVDGVLAVVTEARGIVDDLNALEQTFKDKAGPQQFPSFELLRREFKLIITWLAVADASTGEAGAVAEGGAVATTGGGGGPSIGGAVRNREDVLRALEAVINYYRTFEPSSPVPFLLKRAIRLATMDFLEVMNELTPEAREKIILVVGSVDAPAGKT